MDVRTGPKGRLNIIQDLQKRLADFKSKPRVVGGIELPASEHDYWWYLEFGTGTKHQHGNKQGLPRPASVAEVQGRSDRYPITHRANLGTAALAKKRRIRFTLFGQTYYRVLVMHPGARPANRGRGIVRVGIRQAQISLQQDLKKFKRRKTPPARIELVAAINEALREAVNTIKRLTPEDPDSPHPTHLRESWTYRKAK